MEPYGKRRCQVTYEVFIFRIICCFFLGFLIGLERQWRRRMVGLRTNVLVCLGAFLFVAVGIQEGNGDITRIPAQVVSGIGFLGAGIILRDGNNIKGLNTAATLWCNAAIGVLTASGLIIEALVGTIFILLDNIALRFISHKIMEKKEVDIRSEYTIKLVCTEEKEFIIRTMLLQEFTKNNIVLNNLESKDIENEKVKIYATITMPVNNVHTIERLVNYISMEPGITNIGWKKIEIVPKQIDSDDENE